jgi:hypothetical protein
LSGYSIADVLSEKSKACNMQKKIKYFNPFDESGSSSSEMAKAHPFHRQFVFIGRVAAFLSISLSQHYRL